MNDEKDGFEAAFHILCGILYLIFKREK